MSEVLEIEHKQGATFDYTVEAQYDDVASLSGWSASCHVREPSGARRIITRFDVSEAASGHRLFATAAATSKWPPCQVLEADVRFESPGGAVVKTDTFNIVVLRGVTFAEFET